MSNTPYSARSANHKIKGFIDLVKDIEEKVKGVYFGYDGNMLASQDTIQQVSYEFASKHFETFVKGHNVRILYYLTKIDMSEIDNGIIDLSSPSLHSAEYSSEVAERIFNENKTGLIYLKQPFDSSMQTPELEKEIQDFLTFNKNIPEEVRKQNLTNFLMERKNLIEEIVLFCEVIGLICISQSIYVFSHQVSVNSNFVRLIEMILEVNEPDFLKSSKIHNLAERYFSVFINNLASRVFSEQTLQIVESALSEGRK